MQKWLMQGMSGIPAYCDIAARRNYLPAGLPIAQDFSAANA
jgi:hypothetical protein